MLIVALMGIVGAALLVGGAIAYRTSTRSGVRVLAAAAVGSGLAMWALILWITPVSVVSGVVPPAAVPAVESGPTPGLGPTGEPARGGQKGIGLISTPPADEGPGIAVTPATPPAARPPATATAGAWEHWKGNGYEFRYPQACLVAQKGDYLTVGSRIELAVFASTGPGLAEYVNQFVKTQTQAGLWEVQSQQAVPVAGDTAQRIEYRFGGTNRYGTTVFVWRKGNIYRWQFTAGGSTCDEASAFDGIIASFRFAQ